MTNKTDPRFLMGAGVLAAVALVLIVFGGAQTPANLTKPLEAPKLFEGAPSCALTGEQARTQAIERERDAHARWERVPYAMVEGPNAVRELADAVACFRSAGDRQARARAENDLTVWTRELERLYARTQLNLTLALRAKDAQVSSAEAKALLALLAKSGAPADPYRAFLKDVERASRATLIERLRASEEN